MPGIPSIPVANPRLSNLAVGMVPQDLAFIDRLVPVCRTDVQVGRYAKYTINDKPRSDRIEAFTKPWPTSRAAGTEGTFVCEAHGHEVPAARQQSAAAYESDRQNALWLASRVVQFNKVCAWLALLGDSANYGSNTSSPSTKWSTTSADMRGDLRAKRRVAGQGVQRDTLAMGVDVFEAAIKNEAFLASNRYVRILPSDQSGLQQALADFLGFSAVEVIDLYYNTANEGQTASYDDVWPDETVIAYHRGTPVMEAGQPVSDEAGRPLIAELQPAFARQMVYTGVAGAPQGIAAWEREDAEAGFGVTYMRAAQIYAAPEITQSELGWCFTNCL